MEKTFCLKNVADKYDRNERELTSGHDRLNKIFKINRINDYLGDILRYKSWELYSLNMEENIAEEGCD